MRRSAVSGRSPGSPAPAVVRAAAILHAIADAQDGGQGVTDIARQVDLPTSSTSNILSALTETGLVRSAGTRYMLGPSLVDLAAAYLRQDDPVQRFHAFVATQRVIAAETVQLAVLSGADVLYLAHHNGAQPIALTSGVGRRLPVSCTSMGKAILSSLDDAKVKELVQDPLPQLTPRSHSTVASLQQDLTMTRERGYAVDDEEAALGVVCVGVAVPRRQGDPAYAVSATVFKPRFTPDFEGEVVSDLTTLARVLASS